MASQVDKKVLLKEIETEFDKLKKEVGFKTTLDELDKLFLIKDYLLNFGFVPVEFSYQIRARVSSFYSSWSSYLQGILFPNQGSLLAMSEAKMFTDEEKKEISKMVSKLMAVVSLNNLLNVSRDKKIEKEFFERSIKTWTSIHKNLQEIMKKISDNWDKT